MHSLRNTRPRRAMQSSSPTTDTAAAAAALARRLSFLLAGWLGGSLGVGIRREAAHQLAGMGQTGHVFYTLVVESLAAASQNLSEFCSF